MMKLSARCLALLFSAAPVFAEPLLLDDPAGCGQALGSPDGVLDYAADGGLILGAEGYSSMEYACNFRPAFDFDRQGYSATDHAGRCEMPGPQYFPQLFTIVTDPEEPGVVTIWTGEPEPLRFYTCES